MSATTTFTVRPATLRDAKIITELHNATVCEAFKSATPNAPVPVAALEKNQAHWREAIEYAEPQVQVALDGDTIVGFVGFDRSRDKGTPQTMGEIWHIYVAASHIGSDSNAIFTFHKFSAWQNTTSKEEIWLEGQLSWS